MTAPTVLDPRPATEITPPNHISPPPRTYLSRDARRLRSERGEPTLAEIRTYNATTPWSQQQDRRSSSRTSGSYHAPVLADELHYTPDSAFEYPMKDKNMDMTIRRDHGRSYSYCEGVRCLHAGHKTPAEVRPPLTPGVGVPSFRSPAFSASGATFCRDHRRFDCPLHAPGAVGDCSVATVDLPDIGDLDLPPVKSVMDEPALFVTDSTGVTSIVTMADVAATAEAILGAENSALVAAELSGQKYRDAIAAQVRQPWHAGHFV